MTEDLQRLNISKTGVEAIKEDWGGDGKGRMNLSGRCSVISPEYAPRQYQFFDSK